MAYGFKINNTSIAGYGSIPSIDLTLAHGETIIKKHLIWGDGWYFDTSWGLTQAYQATYFDGNVTTDAPETPVEVELAAAAAEARWDNFIVTVNDDIVLTYDENRNLFGCETQTNFYILAYSHDEWVFATGVAGTYSLKVIDPYGASGTPYVIIETDFESTDVGDEYNVSITREDATTAFKNAIYQVFHKINIYYDNDTSSYKCDTEYWDIFSWIYAGKEPVMAVITTSSGEIKECWMSEHFPIGASTMKFVGVTYNLSSGSLRHEWFFVNSDGTITTDSDNNPIS